GARAAHAPRSTGRDVGIARARSPQPFGQPGAVRRTARGSRPVAAGTRLRGADPVWRADFVGHRAQRAGIPQSFAIGPLAGGTSFGSSSDSITACASGRA